MNKYNHHRGFVTFVAIFLLLAFAYIIGGGVVERETQENYDAAADIEPMPEEGLTL